MVDGVLRRAGLAAVGARSRRGHHRARQLHRHPGRARRGAGDRPRPRSAADRRHQLRGRRRTARSRPGRDAVLLVALESRRADLYVQLFDRAGCPLGAAGGGAACGARRDSPRRQSAPGGRWRSPATPRRAPQRRSALAPARSSSRTGARALGALRCGDAALAWAANGGEVPVQPLYLRPPDVTPAAARLAPPRIVSRAVVSRRLEPVSGAAAGALAAPLSMLHRACFPDDPWSRGRWRRSSRSPGSSGRSPGRTTEPAGLTLALDLGGECEILSLGVVPERRRRGTGSALLAAIGEEAGRRGGHRVFLEVAADNAAARALYVGQRVCPGRPPQPLLPSPHGPGRRAGAPPHDRMRPAFDLSSRSPSSALPLAAAYNQMLPAPIS